MRTRYRSFLMSVSPSGRLAVSQMQRCLSAWRRRITSRTLTSLDALADAAPYLLESVRPRVDDVEGLGEQRIRLRADDERGLERGLGVGIALPRAEQRMRG